MKKKIKWYVGQEVWAITSSYKVVKGVVEDINNDIDHPYPIFVKFFDHKTTFTLDGKKYVIDEFPTLSHTPFTVELKGFSHEYEIESPPVDTPVFVRGSKKFSWKLCYFSHFNKSGGITCFMYGKKSTQTKETKLWNFYEFYLEKVIRGEV